MAVVIAACVPANLAARQNITVEFLGNRWGRAAKAFLDGFGGLFTLAFIGLMAWQFIPYAIEVTDSGQTTWVLQLADRAEHGGSRRVLLLISVPVQLVVVLFDFSRAFRAGATDV